MPSNDNIKEVGLSFTTENGVKFQKTIKEIKNDMNLATAEFQKATSAMEDNKNSIEVLTERQKLYQKQIESQKQKINVLNNELKHLCENEEENAEAIAKKKTEIIKAETQLNKYEKSLKNVNSKLTDSYKENQRLEKELKSIGNELEQVKADYDKEISALKENATETEKLTAKKKLLEKETELQTQKVDDLQKQLDLLTNSEEKNEDAISRKKLELTKAETELNKYNNELKITTNQLESLSAKMIESGGKLQEIGNKVENVGKKVSILSGTIIAGFGGAIATTSNFEDAMRQVAATMGITADEIQRGSKEYIILENAAKECGEATKYSASEAAEALNYMALAGYSAEQSAATLPKVLNLAAAGNLDLATASDMVTDAMAAMNLETKDLDKYIDEMARTSQKSNTSVAQLGEATLTCAGTVSMAKMSLETMNTELGILANNGIKGAEGGTHLRNIILSLTSPTDKAADAIKKLGIQVTDSKGNIRDLNDIMKDFDKKLTGISDSKKTNIISSIFNKTDISAVNALIKGCGSEFENLNNEIKNSNGAAQDMADTMNSSLKGQITLLKSQIEGIAIKLGTKLMPIVKKVVDKISDLATWISNLNDEQIETAIRIGAIVAAIGPLITITGKMINIFGGATKTIGTVIQAIGVMKGTVTSTSTAVNGLANAFSIITNPITLTCAGIGLAIVGIVTAVKLSEKETKQAFSNMGNSASDFVSGIETAKSHLSSFNSTLFASNEEQQKLQQNMDSIQQGITKICQKAADERRGYTQKEIKQLDEYFEKLRELKDKEIQIQSQISQAITQQSTTNAQNFKGSLEEYKQSSQEWIKTAQEQKNATIKLIEEGTIEEIALLNQRYTTEEQRQSEAYQNEYNKIMEQKQSKIDSANEEVAKVTEVYANGYYQRMLQDEEFATKVSELNIRLEEENQRHNNKITEMDNSGMSEQLTAQGYYEEENQKHTDNLKKIWKQLSKGMSDEQAEQLGVFIGMTAESELYGGKLEAEAQSTAENIVSSYASMPNGTRKSMQDAMSPMLEEMEKSEPGLFAKAKGIADGILSRLRKAFDIHSPSRETRKIFKNVMKRCTGRFRR